MATQRPRTESTPRSVREAERVARQAPQEVRIIGGRFKRSPLSVPTWPGLRPTSSRVRETLFNWLGQDLAGWRVLDAFAGSGALGLEAASRGAETVTMLEREPALARGIEANVRKLGAQGVSVVTADALAWMKQQALRQPGAFDLVLLDPPFEAKLFDEALVAATSCVPPGGWIYLEAPLPCVSPDSGDGKASMLTLPPGLRVHRQGKAGAVHYHLIERVDSPPNAPAQGG